ncbi:MAG: 50S ribosomal protein L24 [Flammeovirgaceae bacterium]
MERKFNKQPKLHVRKGDTVKILSGNDKGKEGKILEILIDKDRAIVEGINIITKHQKPSAGKPEGGIKKTEGTIHLSNLMLIEPGTGKAVRTGRKLDSKGKLQRYSKKSGEFIKQ